MGHSYEDGRLVDVDRFELFISLCFIFKMFDVRPCCLDASAEKWFLYFTLVTKLDIAIRPYTLIEKRISLRKVL